MRNKLKIFGMVVLMLTTVIFMSSCNKNEKNIVGKWKVTNSTDHCEDGETWYFKDNGSCYVTCEEFGGELDGEYSISKNSLTITANYIEGYDYSVKLRWDMDIDVLTKKEMSLSGTVKLTEVDDGYSYSETEKVSYDFVKR